MNFKFRGFEGWYFHHQKGDRTISFIPGHTKDYAFIQVNSSLCSFQFDVPDLTIENGVIKAGRCMFSRKGCKVDLPGIRGQLRYRNLTPLKSDIMGPFQYLPMQCRHGVISMHHSLIGSITLHDHVFNFDEGNGYIELDCGTSFPKSYLWVQCNDFPEPCSIMISIAHIPFCGASFTGCICAIIYKGHEYRLATYNGVRILAYQPNHICLLQGKRLLEVDLMPSSEGNTLSAPVLGSMCKPVHESNNAGIRVRLSDHGGQIFQLESRHAMYEYVP